MKVEKTAIPGVLIVEPLVFGDERGFFMESYNEREMRKIGVDGHFVQDNHSRSARNVLRGLHYQIIQPQGKLLRVVSGKVFDVAVDLRRDSSAFGKWVGVELSAENKRIFWLPPGMAHGFVVLSDSADFVYKASHLQNSTERARSVRARLQSCRQFSRKMLGFSPCVSLFSIVCNSAAAKAGILFGFLRHDSSRALTLQTFPTSNFASSSGY
jgi:dTDP-4-dehydrorhamnose 3,5-epimerase